jgi:hypothetical protein
VLIRTHVKTLVGAVSLRAQKFYSSYLTVKTGNNLNVNSEKGFKFFFKVEHGGLHLYYNPSYSSSRD